MTISKFLYSSSQSYQFHWAYSHEDKQDFIFNTDFCQNNHLLSCAIYTHPKKRYWLRWASTKRKMGKSLDMSFRFRDVPPPGQPLSECGQEELEGSWWWSLLSSPHKTLPPKWIWGGTASAFYSPSFSCSAVYLQRTWMKPMFHGKT